MGSLFVPYPPTTAIIFFLSVYHCFPFPSDLILLLFPRSIVTSFGIPLLPTLLPPLHIFPFLFSFLFFPSLSSFSSPLYSSHLSSELLRNVRTNTHTHTHHNTSFSNACTLTLSLSHVMHLWIVFPLKVMCFGDLSVPLLFDSLTHTYILRLPHVLPSALNQLKYSSTCQFINFTTPSNSPFPFFFSLFVSQMHAHTPSLNCVWLRGSEYGLPGSESFISQ